MYNFTIYRNDKVLRTVQVAASSIGYAMEFVFNHYSSRVDDKAVCGKWIFILGENGPYQD